MQECPRSLAWDRLQNTEPDLIRSFEIEGGRDAYEENVKSAARWLYMMSFDDDLISEY